MIQKTDKFLLVSVALIPLAVLAAAGFCLGYSGDKSIVEKNTAALSADISVAEANISPQYVALPDSLNLDVPFITQAPYMLWKEYPFNYTCEEASVLMVHYYLSGIRTVDENTTKQELMSLVDFENKNYGFSNDTTAEETAKFIRDYYGYDAQVFYNISSEDIKRELARQNPVIVPTAGRLLGNPYFTGLGPLFHMLVIKGYDSEGFITNDPGTYNRGIDYKYSYEVLETAIRDFDKINKKMDERSAMIVVSLPK